MLVCLVNSKNNRSTAVEVALNLLNDMRKRYAAGDLRLQPHSICYNIVIDGWARVHNPFRAEDVFLIMCSDFEAGNLAAKPQTTTFNSTFSEPVSCFM